MSQTNACFENVVGLSRNTCECYGTPPEDYDVSASGLYVDEAPGFNFKKIHEAAECNEDGWSVLTKAREDGQREFINMVLQGVKMQTRDRRPLGRSVIGKEKGTKALRLPNTYHGLDVKFHWIRGGKAIIKRIGGAFKFSGSVTVEVYDEVQDTPLYTRTITAVQNKKWWTDIEPIEVDLSNLDGDHPRLWFLFTPTEGQEALDISVAPCGCGGKAKWTHDMNTCAAGVVVDGNTWTAWLVAGGVKNNTLSTREDWTHSNETQGLMLDVEFKCDGKTVLCFGEPDYEGDIIQRAFARGVQLESALRAIAYATGSTRVVCEAIAGGDETELTRVALRKDRDEVLNWLIAVLTMEGDDGEERSGVNRYSDCLACKDVSNMQVRTIPR